MFRTSRVLLALGLVAALTGVTVTSAIGAKRNTFKATANLDAKRVVSGGGDTDGRGEADLKFKKAKRKVCFDITYRKIDRPTKGFIGEGEKGEEGDDILTLFEDSSSTREESGCEKGISKSEIRDIEDAPKDFFVALETEEFPKGAIRGQLREDR